MNSSQEIATKIEEFILKNFNVTEKINHEFDIFESRIIDSIGVIELVSFLEKEFNISIPFETISIVEIRNIKLMVEFVQKKSK